MVKCYRVLQLVGFELGVIVLQQGVCRTLENLENPENPEFRHSDPENPEFRWFFKEWPWKPWKMTWVTSKNISCPTELRDFETKVEAEYKAMFVNYYETLCC